MLPKGHHQPNAQNQHSESSSTGEPKKDEINLFSVEGFLIFAGGIVCAYFYFHFDTSVSIAFGRVNNLGLMQDKNNGLIVGGLMLVVGIIHFVTKRNQNFSASSSAADNSTSQKAIWDYPYLLVLLPVS